MQSTGNLRSGGRVVVFARRSSANNLGSGRGCLVECDRRKPGSGLVQCSGFAGIANGRCCRVPSPRGQYFAMGCRNTQGSRRSGKLVAPACWRAILSCVSNNLASFAVARFEASVHFCGKALDLGRGGPVDLRHDSGGGAISLASREPLSYAHRTMALCDLSGFRSHDRLRGASDSATRPDPSNSRLPCGP